MRFRPCIDIHNASVKQIVGSSLADKGDYALDNFVSQQDGAYYAKLYKKYGLRGGHIIILNPKESPYYEGDLKQAFSALKAWEGGLQIGGGINAENAKQFLDGGASHVIVTSYVFKDGQIAWDNLEKLVKAVGKQHLVLDLSCRAKNGRYYIVTDRWQKFTDVELDGRTLDTLSGYCDEFLVHAADVEGKTGGIQEDVAKILGEHSPVPSTYAGGISSFGDIEKLRVLGDEKVDFTVGSTLDIFGGKMSFERIAGYK